MCASDLGQQRHHGLAAADVALQQAQHADSGHHVGVDFFHGRFLAGGELEGQGVEHPGPPAAIAPGLDPGLAPENPLDGFGEFDDFDGKLRDCFAALMADPNTALGVFFLDLRTDSDYSQLCAQAGVAAFATTAKPLAFAPHYRPPHRGR